MKTLKINGVEQAIPSQDLNFQTYMSDLNKTLNLEKHVISKLVVDGKEISEQEESDFYAKTLQELADVEIETSNPAEIAFETIDTLFLYLDRMVTTIERAAESYENKNLVGGDHLFSKSIDGLDLFVQTLGGIKLALRVGLHPKIALVEASLVSIMNDLLDAKRQHNYIFLAELLRKDLTENLQEWKKDILPILKNWNVV